MCQPCSGGCLRRAGQSAPSFSGLSPASAVSSRIARASSRKRDTKPELLLRRALREAGFAYRIDVASLPGRPDLVVPAARLAIFCDGDFWHGRNLRQRLGRLAAGHNSLYWTEKLSSNVRRDRQVNQLLRKLGWTVLRFWESDISSDPQRAIDAIVSAIGRKRASK